LLRDLQAVNESGTRSFEVKRCGLLRANLLLNETRGRRERHVGRDGGDDDEVNLLARNAGHFHRALRGFGGEVGGEFILGRESTFLDAGARGDPFVGRVHHFFES